MDDRNTLNHHPAPSVGRPLLGMTILVAEDSLYASDAMRLMCLHSGARIRRADSLRSARRHLQVYRPSAVVIDLGLPDGSGLDLIRELDGAQPRVVTIIGTSGDAGGEAAALAAGANAFLAKPVVHLGHFQQTVLRTLPADHQPNGLRVVREDQLHPDPMAYRDDMIHVANLLDQHDDGPVLDYVAQFLDGVARSADDGPLADAAQALARQRADRTASRSTVARIAGMVQDRLASRAAI